MEFYLRLTCRGISVEWIQILERQLADFSKYGLCRTNNRFAPVFAIIFYNRWLIHVLRTCILFVSLTDAWTARTFQENKLQGLQFYRELLIYRIFSGNCSQKSYSRLLSKSSRRFLLKISLCVSLEVFSRNCFLLEQLIWGISSKPHCNIP